MFCIVYYSKHEVSGTGTAYPSGTLEFTTDC